LEIAIGVVVTLLVSVVGWILYHSAQCSAFHERIARLESMPPEVAKLREHAHENRTAILRLESNVALLDRKVETRQKWQNDR
jgi:hypothetical protein